MGGSIVPSMTNMYNLGASLAVWANVYATNVVATNLTGTLLTAAQPNITSVGTLAGLTVAGNIVPSANNTYNLGSALLQWANIYCASVTPTGNIIPSADNTYNLGSMTYRWAATYSVNVNATNLTGTLQTAAQPNITSVGTLSGLTVSASILPSITNTDNLGSGTLLWATVYATAINATNLTGTLQTAAQPNITSVGTLSGLTVAGNVVPSANNTYNLGSSLLQWANIYCAGFTPAGNILPSADDMYNLGSMTFRWATTYSVNVNATYLTGTLQTAAQPNITSVGILAGLTVSGNLVPSIPTVGNIGGSSQSWANVYSTNIIATAVSATNLTGTLQTAPQPNITSVGTLISLTVTNVMLAGLVRGNTAIYVRFYGTASYTGAAGLTYGTSLDSAGGTSASATLSAGGINVISYNRAGTYGAICTALIDGIYSCVLQFDNTAGSDIIGIVLNITSSGKLSTLVPDTTPPSVVAFQTETYTGSCTFCGYLAANTTVQFRTNGSAIQNVNKLNSVFFSLVQAIT